MTRRVPSRPFFTDREFGDFEEAIGRFWARVDRSAGPDACWPWRGVTSQWGYGQVVLNRMHAAHRIAFLLVNGPVGDLVLHHCDNPPCVNPAHLFAGTQAENMADMWRKGRGAWGDRNPMRRYPEKVRRGADNHASKLTVGQVALIKRRLAAGEPKKWIATAFGVSPATIRAISQGRTWVYVQAAVA